MALSLKSLSLVLSFLLLAVSLSKAVNKTDLQRPPLVRSDFPADFQFGASTSAIQTESYPNEGGRGPATWDYFLGGEPAVQSYFKYKDDVECLKKFKANSYRFSIAWPRLLPTGKLSGGINQEGIDFYNNLINELVANGIKPFATLFHFDLPLALQKEYNGLLSPKFVEDYTAFADLCFKTFGDRVQHWITLNEPEVFAAYGYQSNLSISDDPARYPYIAAHHIILAHASAAKVYRETYQATQKGEIGMALSTQWFLPLNMTAADKHASNRAWDFLVGWFLDPLVHGDYPYSMRLNVGDRLPNFTREEQEMVKGSYDFVGVNYYTSRYVEATKLSSTNESASYENDQHLETLTEKNGVPIGEQAGGFDQIYVYPAGLGRVLQHMKLAYKNPKIFITENGYPDKRNDSIPIKTALQDDKRIMVLQEHLYYVKNAIRRGVNVKGYFVWSLVDDMEMGSYYTIRFGLCYIDYQDNYKRYPKKSVTWYRKLITGETSH